jgi:starch synthase
MIASEVSPWAKTGGLADVVGALPEALEQLGHLVTVVMPRYRGVTPPEGASSSARLTLGSFALDVGLQVSELSRSRRLVTVEAPALFDRAGLYQEGGRDYADNAERFGVLSAAALEHARTLSGSRPVDVIHTHDWQAGLAPALVRTDARYGSLAGAGLVHTIHNLAYQGLFPRDVLPRLGLSWRLFTMQTGEFWGQFSFLKTAITLSDYVTTVSPSYATETRRPEFGAGLDGVLSARTDRYVGILNGIDARVWDPATDPHLPAHFDMNHLAGKAACKRALLERLSLSVGDDALARPLIGMVSRLVEQKGLDLVADAAPELIELDATWVFVGTGDQRYEDLLRGLASRYPTRVAAFIGFSEPLAHLVEAGADMFLMPSRFEPCGLNQMYSLRYGTVPIVTAVGGLDDTVQPYTTRARHANGFKFKETTAEALVRTVRHAVRLYHDRPKWLRLMREGMGQDLSWQTSAKEYVKVYRRARAAASDRGAA